MSNDISYVLKVVDDFSGNLRKFQTQIGGVNKQTLGYSQNVSQAQKSTKFFTQNLLDLGKATGIFMGVSGMIGFGKEIFNTRIQMDSMASSLSAILPKFDKSKSGVQLASEEMEYLRGVTNKLGVSFETALPNYMQFLAGSKDNLETTRKTFEAFAGLSRMYGLDNQRFGLVINALSQMQSKGVVSMEELRQQLGDSLPGALKLFSDAAGMSTAQFTKLVAEGRIGSGIIKVVGENISKIYGQDISNASQTLGSKTARLGNEWLRFKDVLGQQFAPAMAGTVAGLTDGLIVLGEVFGAINNQTAFAKLDDDMKPVVTTLQIIRDLFQSIGTGISSISKVAGGFWNLGKDIISTATIGAYQAYGAGEMALSAVVPGKQDELVRSGQRKLEFGGDAFKEIIQNNKQRYFTPEQPAQKIELQINHVNAPKGTTIEMKNSPTTNLRVGNTVAAGGI